MEFLGCRYPKETMDLVEELSFGIVQEYREQQKGRLQRTFVSGSAAASGKVNRSGPAGAGGSKRKSDGSKATLYGNFVAASSASNETSSKSDHNEASSKCEDEPPAKKFVPKNRIEAPPLPPDAAEDRLPVVPDINA